MANTRLKWNLNRWHASSLSKPFLEIVKKKNITLRYHSKAYHFYTNKIVIHRDSHDFIRLEVLIYALKKRKKKKEEEGSTTEQKKIY